MRRAAALAATALLVTGAACGGASGSGRPLLVSGSTTVNPLAAEAAEVLREERGMRITVDSQGGSSGGIAQLGQGQIDVAMSSRPLTDEDRGRYPSVDFTPTVVGEDALGIVVRREVFDGGVRNLTRHQLRALFEGRVANWREVGGPDLAVFVYDKEPGRGTREVLENYLYGVGDRPPPPTSSRYAIVGGNEEGRTKAASTPGAVTPLSVAFVEGSTTLVAVAVEGVDPTLANLHSGGYPLSRTLFLITDGPPSGAAAELVDFVLSAAGAEIARRHGFIPPQSP